MQQARLALHRRRRCYSTRSARSSTSIPYARCAAAHSSLVAAATAACRLCATTPLCLAHCMLRHRCNPTLLRRRSGPPVPFRVTAARAYRHRRMDGWMRWHTGHSALCVPSRARRQEGLLAARRGAAWLSLAAQCGSRCAPISGIPGMPHERAGKAWPCTAPARLCAVSAGSSSRVQRFGFACMWLLMQHWRRGRPGLLSPCTCFAA